MPNSMAVKGISEEKNKAPARTEEKQVFVKTREMCSNDGISSAVSSHRCQEFFGGYRRESLHRTQGRKLR